MSHNVYTGIIKWSPDVDTVLWKGDTVIQQTLESSRNRLVSMLLRGE